MPRAAIHIPADDWGAAGVQLQLWLVEIGDDVDVGDALAELSLPGMIGELVAPVSGRIVELHAASDRIWHAGDVVGYLETVES
jgi:pyruvate/2-oxoglutarate dehydrogenase complex dihydrolipoamide acyltransferase (E2) component